MVQRRSNLPESADSMIGTLTDRRDVLSKRKIRFKGYTKITGGRRRVEEASSKGNCVKGYFGSLLTSAKKQVFSLARIEGEIVGREPKVNGVKCFRKTFKSILCIGSRKG